MNAIAQPAPFTDSRRQAKFLYWTGWRVTDIADYLGEKERTVHSWKSRDEWDRADNVERIGGRPDGQRHRDAAGLGRRHRRGRTGDIVRVLRVGHRRGDGRGGDAEHDVRAPHLQSRRRGSLISDRRSVDPPRIQ